MKFIRFTLGIYEKKQENLPYNLFGDKVIVIPKPWSSIRNHFLNVLCHVHVKPEFNSRFKIPLKRIWYKGIVDKWIDIKEETCILFNAHYYSLFDNRFVRYVHGFPNKIYTVIYLSDKYEFYKSHYRDFPSYEQLKQIYDLVLTYNVSDAEKYGFVLERPSFKNYDNSLEYNDILGSDVFFVGREKGRLKEIIDIYEQCTKAGLFCDFYITEVKESEMRYRDRIHYNEPMTYTEVLKRSRSTKCIVNLVQDSGAGVTLRDYEAFGYQKFLITNNYALLQTELYDSKQVIWIKDLPDRVHEIANGYSAYRNLADIYSEENYFNWIEKMIVGA